MPIYSPNESVQKCLKNIGANLKTARLRRNITIQEAAEKIGVSKSSIERMEKGDASVKVGVFISAAEVYQALDTIAILEPGHDMIGLSLEKQRLPKRARKKNEEKLNF